MVSRPWGGRGRVVRETRGMHVWAARTWSPDNFAKLRRAMKVARTSPSGEWEIRGRSRTRTPGDCCFCSQTELACLSESRSIAYIRSPMRRAHSERSLGAKTTSPPLGHSAERVGALPSSPTAISHCRCSVRESECELQPVVPTPQSFFYEINAPAREWLM